MPHNAPPASSRFSYFRVEFDIPPARVHDVMDFAGRDVDVVRYGVFKVEEPQPFQCTFHEETQPPPYRSVPAGQTDWWTG